MRDIFGDVAAVTRESRQPISFIGLTRRERNRMPISSFYLDRDPDIAERFA